jgi:hypothetical protein
MLSHGILANCCLELPPNQCLLFLNNLTNPMAKIKPKIKSFTKIKVENGQTQ